MRSYEVTTEEDTCYMDVNEGKVETHKEVAISSTRTCIRFAKCKGKEMSMLTTKNEEYVMIFTISKSVAPEKHTTNQKTQSA